MFLRLITDEAVTTWECERVIRKNVKGTGQIELVAENRDGVTVMLVDTDAPDKQRVLLMNNEGKTIDMIFNSREG